MTSHAKDARTGLADLLDWVGPDAPTLCEGWDARDLAAHLAIRDRRPDALPGIGISAFAKHTQKVQDEMAARPYPEVVDLVRFGPPVYNLTRLKAVDERVNLVEYFVHTEDVLRAQPDWHEPRTLDHDVEDALFSALSMMGRLAFRSSPWASWRSARATAAPCSRRRATTAPSCSPAPPARSCCSPRGARTRSGSRCPASPQPWPRSSPSSAACSRGL
ncbi:TIGR03085 family metal-binding protein [Arsenicicoccus piscis]|uniref:TIGR03085 family protein n=1 Tax=Arsenicicoccus piscis TaxID=673954 RepID=A0ABQ6HPD7_9MICO|nr:TIGR03085 family metal-binding protein [Arsenicicoccus piscis]GMA19294.1 hypothetical protein GCM10025862_13150 [Arsenicicoccus piscis]